MDRCGKTANIGFEPSLKYEALVMLSQVFFIQKNLAHKEIRLYPGRKACKIHSIAVSQSFKGRFTGGGVL